MSFGNWRGYRGIWELADDALYLVGFEFGFGGLGLERLFPDRVKDGKVLADWYNSKLIIPKGNVLRWDGIFSRTYIEEEHLTIPEWSYYIPENCPKLCGLAQWNKSAGRESIFSK